MIALNARVSTDNKGQGPEMRWLGHSSLQTTLIYLEILPDPLGDINRVP